MKIQIIKKAGNRNPVSSVCNWFIEGLPEPTR
jgi:hypothetical protein